jgi:hypothetical protein
LGHEPEQEIEPLIPELIVNRVTPVTLPPGRLRVATKPYFTGSTPPSKTMGIVEVAVFAASIELRSAGCENHADLTQEQVGGHFCQNALIVRSPEFDGDVIALDISSVSEAPAEIRYDLLGGFERRSMEKPDHRNARLLRLRHHRPRRGAVKGRNKFAPSCAILKLQNWRVKSGESVGR